MRFFRKSKSEREKEYMSKIDVSSCLKEDFKMVIDDVFTIVGTGTVAIGIVLTGMCRIGEKVYINRVNGGNLEATITIIDVHTKERKLNGCAYKTEHIGVGLSGISKEQLEKGDTIIVKNSNKYII